jgi:hypothetical protein
MAKKLTGAVVTDGDDWVWRARVDLGDPQALVDLSEDWCGGGATLSGRTEAARGEVAVVAGGGAVEGSSGH